MKPRSAGAAAALAFGLVLASCGGGGGGGGGGPTTPQPGITFIAESGSAPAVRLARGPGSSGTTLEIQVRADQLSGVYAFGFDLSYPAALLRFDGSSEGGFLGAGGADTSLQVAEASPGRLIVGYSRLGDVGAAGGSGELMTLRFTGVGAGGGSLSFSETRVFDPTGSEIRGPSWLGGTVQVTP